MAVYLGQEGYCLDFEFREGKQHCQKDTPALLKKTLGHARAITQQPLLLRLDGGNDSIENIDVIQVCRYLVKDFGTSQSPKSTRQRDSRYCP
ncbi:MAG: hypothetical protein AB2813_15710, partial [Candidatus Sedimenticola endophacoides]